MTDGVPAAVTGTIPTIGRIVWYRDIGETCPAIVLGATGESTGDADEYRRINLTVFTTRGTRVEYGVPYGDDERMVRVWSWPDRVP